VPELIQVIINATIRSERQQYLKAEPYQHTEERQGHAKDGAPGWAASTSPSRRCEKAGVLPKVLEKGLWSERALFLTLADMYVLGISTRKVKAATE